MFIQRLYLPLVPVSYLYEHILIPIPGYLYLWHPVYIWHWCLYNLCINISLSQFQVIYTCGTLFISGIGACIISVLIYPYPNSRLSILVAPCLYLALVPVSSLYEHILIPIAGYLNLWHKYRSPGIGI